MTEDQVERAHWQENKWGQPFDFGKMGEVQGEAAVTAREGEGEERSTDLVHLPGDIAYLVADGRPSSKMDLYVLKQDVSAATKRQKERSTERREEAEREINVKDICGS